MPARNILLYGASTPLGKRLAFYLDGWAEHRLYKLSLRTRPGVPAMIGAIHDDMWEPLIGAGGVERPDLVIDCFSYENHNDPVQMWTNNVLRPVAIALAARTASIPFLFVSTDKVLNGDSVGGLFPRTPYGITMSHGETFTRQFHKRTTVVRLSDLYGFDVDSTPVKATRNVVSPTFIGEAAFLIARNILEQDLPEGIVHCVPPFKDTMYDFLMKRSPTLLRLEHSGNFQFGLDPTPDWMLPGDPEKSWGEARREWGVQKYIRYW